MTRHRIAAVPGDGVGPEVTQQALRVLEASGVDLQVETLDWGTAHFHRHGRMAPEDFTDRVRHFDAVLMGAVGDPSLPDHVTLWGLLLPLRQELDLWANVRPVRLLRGVPSPLRGSSEDDIDMVFVRENTEGEYSGVGGRAHEGLPHEVAIETSVFTRTAVRRVIEHAFRLAQGRRRLVTSATKSNASRFGYVLWDEIADEVAAEYRDVRLERMLVDALAARMVQNPGSLDVVVASNLFGDILTDLGAAIQGGMGLAASANVAPGAAVPGIFEPVHGSAPDIAGRGIANPSGCIWSAAMLLDAIGEQASGARVLAALEATLDAGIRTPDLGGRASTEEFGSAVIAALIDLTESAP